MRSIISVLKQRKVNIVMVINEFDSSNCFKFSSIVNNQYLFCYYFICYQTVLLLSNFKIIKSLHSAVILKFIVNSSAEPPPKLKLVYTPALLETRFRLLLVMVHADGNALNLKFFLMTIK